MTVASRAPAGPPAVAWGGSRAGKRLARNLMRLVPIRLCGRLVPRRVIGLCYHTVSDRALPHVRHLYGYKTPGQFERDLLYLKRNFRLLSYEELEAGEPAGPDAAIVTFDDGLAECHSVARPLLLEHGVPCVFFVSPRQLDNRHAFTFCRASLCIDALQAMPQAEARRVLGAAGEAVGLRFDDVAAFARWITVWIRTLRPEEERRLDEICALAGVDPERFLAERRPYLTTEQVRELAADGFTIGAHGMRHVALGAFPPEEVETQIVESCRAVRELTGRARVPFAFPFDADGVDRDLLAELRARHPFVGLLFDTREVKRDRDFMVNRMIVDLPPSLGGARSNLPSYLRSAYLDEFRRLARGEATP